MRRGSLDDIRAEDAHLLAIRAHLAAARGVMTVSHQSAAIVHGFAMWAPDLGKVHVTVNRASGGRTTKTSHVHAAELTAEDTDVVDGFTVTSADRTVADLLRILRFEAAVCVGDAALRTGRATVDGIEGALARSSRKGAVGARRALSFCDARSESVGESRSRILIDRLGYPAPQLQLDVYGPGRKLLGRSDFGFTSPGVLGEFDGMVKYSEYVPPGHTAGDVVFREKRREDAMRSCGWVMARWTWSDLERPERLASTLQRAFDLARTLPAPKTFGPRVT